MFDAVAAARISPVEGRDLPYIRSKRPSETEWATARRRAQVDTESAEEFLGRLRRALADLSDRERLSIVEAGGAGITLTVVGVDGFGLLRRRHRPTVPWCDLVPMLAAGPADELRFRLAGGFGGVDRIRLWAELERNLARLVPLPDGHRVMPVCTAPGWPVPERALAVLGRGRTPHPPSRLAGGDVSAIVSRAVADLPLRTHLELVVAQVDPGTGQVYPDGVRLFTAGDPVGTERSLAIRCVHPHPDGTVLAVVNWRDDGPRALSIGSVRLPAGVHRLRAVLAGAGRVEFVEPEGIVPDHRPWSELMATLPDRLAPEIAELDVLCLLDLSGDGLEPRRRLAAEFVRLAARRFPEPGRLRVAVIGYGRHDFRMEAEDAGVLQGKWLAPAAAALDTLDGLRPVGPDQISGAPVEDALRLAARGIARIPPERRVVMLTFGDRPPHPPREDPDGLLPCPRGHNWRTQVQRIRQRAGLLSVAVLSSAEHLGPAWRQIGGTALLRLDRTDARKLAAVSRIVVPESGRLAFPLPAPEG